MKATLKKFTTASLYEASKAMLKRLNIRYKTQSKEPINFKSLYSRVTSQQIPKSLVSVLSKVKESYYIGAIDEDTLKGRDSLFDIDDICNDKYQTMLVFAIEVDSEVSITRSEYATLTRGFNRITASIPVTIYIKKGNSVSIATCERTEYRQNWRDGEKLGKVSILKDINCENPHRGHLDILESLKCNKAYTSFENLYQHWMRVFSTELLTEKFYTELSEWYAWVIGSENVKFPNNINTSDDDTEYNHEAVIRLITRLIFVWFLKQKNLIPDMFFNKEEIQSYFIENFDPSSTSKLLYNPEESKYYRLILQNLFFAVLNRPIRDGESSEGINRRFVTDKRYHGKSTDFNINNLLRYRDEFKVGGAEKFLDTANSQIPFLNGGLFECLDHKDKNDPEYGMFYDGFSENGTVLKQLSFPDYFFFSDEHEVDLSSWYDDTKKNHVKVRGIIDILHRYNFTVEENTPLDQEVSLDPELLGKVFENLLAAYNPEINTTIRKKTGSFYTPRPIVQYMVDESLTAYLAQTCPHIQGDSLRRLFSYSSESLEMTDAERKTVMSALHSCKILDPACGSGAFPMGVLQQMVHVLRKIDPSNQLWRSFILEWALAQDRKAYDIQDEKRRAERRRDIEDAFDQNVNDPDYARKLYLIENCIYGVDIQPIATQISKLRFFISLVAEQKPTSDPTKNFGIRPLPNLETKIIAANSLIPLSNGFLWTEIDKIKEVKETLKQAHHEFFLARRSNLKREIREKIRMLRREYADALMNMGAINDESASWLAQWDMFNQNDYARFFDPHWMFGITGGFDVVIGNPPYVVYSGKESEKLSSHCCPDALKIASGGKMNAYKIFLSHSLKNLCKKDGVLSFIFQNSFMADREARNLRKYVLSNCQILLLDSFPERDNKKKRVFPSVKMSVCIATIKNGRGNQPFNVSIWDDKWMSSGIKTEYTRDEIFLIDKDDFSIPRIPKALVPIIKKMICKRYHKLVCNEGELNVTNHKKYFSQDKSNPVIMKGAGIQRYYYTYDLSQGSIEYLMEEEYLSDYSRSEKSSHHKYRRIVMQGMTGANDERRLIMTLIPEGMYLAHSCKYIIDCNGLSLNALLAILNSDIANLYFRCFSTNSNVNGYEIENIPIPYISPDTEAILVEKVEEILKLKEGDYRADSKEKEKEIDKIVLELYGFSDDEVAVISAHL